MPKKVSARDAFEAAEITKAVSYNVFFIRGPGVRYSEAAATEAEARAIAARMNANHGEYGRRACIYAILADGRSYALPNQEV